MKRTKTQLHTAGTRASAAAWAVAASLAVLPSATLAQDQTDAQIIERGQLDTASSREATLEDRQPLARWYGPHLPGMPCPYFPVPGGPCHPL